MTGHPRRRLAVWVGSLGLAAGGLFAAIPSGATVTNTTASSSAPTLDSAAPAAIGAGVTTPVTLTLSGSGFASGANVTLANPQTGNPDGVTVTTGSVTVTSPTTITAKLTTSAGAVPGPRTITVTNTDGQAASLTNHFVVDLAPTLTEPASVSVGQGAVDFPVTLHGSSIQPGAVATVTLPASPTDLAQPPNNGVTLSQGQHDSTSLPVWLDVAPSATARGRILTVTNPDGGFATVPLTVDATPTFASADTTAVVTGAQSVSPPTIGQGAHGITVKISGSGFRNGAKVDFGTGISHGATTVSSDGKTVTVADVTVAPDAPAGGRQINIVNGDGSLAKTNMTVDATTLTAVQPASLRPGDSGQFMTLSGSGYGRETKVAISGIKVNSVKLTPDSQLAVNVDVPKAAKPGMHSVTMTDSDGGTAICRTCFSIDDFKVTKVKPDTATDTGPVSLIIRGKHIPDGVRLELTPKSGIYGQPVLFATKSQVTHNGTVYTGRVNLRGAAPGDYDVRLAAAKHAGTCVCTLAVKAGAPKLTAVAAPTGIASGDLAVPLTLTGTNFSRGMVVTLPNGVTAVDPVAGYVSPTKLVQSVNLGFVTAGKFDVTLTAADKQAVTCKQCLTVQAAPAVSGMSPSSLQQGANKARITVMGSNFVAGSTLDLGPGITIEGTPDVTDTAIRATVDVAAYVQAATIPLHVIGPYGATGQCFSCPKVTAATPQPGRFFPLPRTQLFAGTTRAHRIQVAGTAGVPADTDAALLDVTVAGPDEPDQVLLTPTGQLSAPPVMDVPSGGAAEHTVTATLGRGGAVTLRLRSARARVSVAVVGYYRYATGGAALTTVSPDRLLYRTLSAGDTTVALPNAGAQPQGARAALVQLAVTGISQPARMTVAPAGGANVGGLQLAPGGGTSSLFTVWPGNQNALTLSLSAGTAEASLTLVGWYVVGTAPAFTPLPATTLVTSSPLTPGEDAHVQLAGAGGIPINASAVLVTITAVHPNSTELLTASPGGGSKPVAEIPVARGQEATTSVVVPLAPLGDGSAVVGLTGGQADLSVVVLGYFR